MPRMRTLKPEAATSETLARVPPNVRWTFGMLWTYLDDEGRGLRNTRLIKAAIYPLDDDMTPDVVDAQLVQLAGIGAVCFYEAEGRQHVHVPAWHEHQHPNRKVDSKLPPCPKSDHSEPTHEQRSEPAVSTHGALTSVVVVEGSVDGEGDGGGGGANREPQPGSTTPAESVRAFVLACPEPPAKALQTRIEKQARALLAEGHDPGRIITAAASAGRAGWTDLAVQMQRDAARASPLHGARSTTDDRTRSALDLAERLDRKAIE